VNEYDSILKVLFQSSATATLRELTGTEVVHWLNVEFPKVQHRQVDLLGETGDGELLHIELQSSNDSGMPLRMAEYFLAIYRSQQRFPRQLVVYVGREPLDMSAALNGPGMQFHYDLIDMREVDGDRLLSSAQVSDNVIGILGRVADTRAAVRRLVERIAELDPDDRMTYLRSLFVVAGLRGLAKMVEGEARTMPVHINILENEVLGREYLKGLQQGRDEGRQEGRQAGRHEGESSVLRRQIEKRFGTLPLWAEKRIAEAPVEQLETWAIAVLDAPNLEELLR